MSHDLAKVPGLTPVSTGKAVALGTAQLRHLPDTVARLEAERLLALATGLTRTAILAWPERPLAPEPGTAYLALLQQRAAGVPFSYLSRRQPFWTLELQVSPATLIPRPETELLVELALESLPAEAPLRVADLGTGSGAIAAALARERPRWQLVATDRSAAALCVARTNLRSLGQGNIELVRGDWLAPFAPSALHALLSNPPYVREDDPHLERGDLRYEPRAALIAGPDGLAALRAIIETAPRALRPGGLVALEHGCDQGAEVRRLFAAAGCRGIRTRRDMAGHERVTYARTRNG